MRMGLTEDDVDRGREWTAPRLRRLDLEQSDKDPASFESFFTVSGSPFALGAS